MIIDAHCHAGRGDTMTAPWTTSAPLGKYLRRAAAAGIDRTIELSETLYEGYTDHVASQLARAPLGTKVATFYGRCQEIPPGYEPVGTTGHRSLKFWVKQSEPPSLSVLS